MTDEKMHEKEMDKREEKHDEKWANDPLSSMVWALILIWAGVVLLAPTLGYEDLFTRVLDALPLKAAEFNFEIWFVGPEALQVFLIGVALLLLVEIVLRLLVPAYRKGVFGTFIFAVVLFCLVTQQWALIGPAVLIAFGLSVLLRGLRR